MINLFKRRRPENRIQDPELREWAEIHRERNGLNYSEFEKLLNSIMIVENSGFSNYGNRAILAIYTGIKIPSNCDLKTFKAAFKPEDLK